MKKKEFQNLPSTKTPINADNLNEMQDNIEESCVVVSPTEPTTNENVWIQKGKNIYNPNTMPFSTGLWGNSNDKKVFANSGGKYVVIPIQGGTTITISKESNAIYYATTSAYPASGVDLLDNWAGSETINKVTIATNQNANYLFLGLYSTTKLMVEYNSTATEYEEYIEKKINVDGVEFLDVEKANAQQNYSTTEQVIGTWIDGKPLYRKTINFGVLPNNTTKDVNHSISNLERVIALYGTTDNGTTHLTIPYIATIGLNYSITLNCNKTSVTAVTGSDRTAYTNTYIVIEYTKTTD